MSHETAPYMLDWLVRTRATGQSTLVHGVNICILQSAHSQTFYCYISQWIISPARMNVFQLLTEFMTAQGSIEAD